MKLLAETSSNVIALSAPAPIAASVIPLSSPVGTTKPICPGARKFTPATWKFTFE